MTIKWNRNTSKESSNNVKVRLRNFFLVALAKNIMFLYYIIKILWDKGPPPGTVMA